MFETFFGFKKTPFASAPDPKQQFWIISEIGISSTLAGGSCLLFVVLLRLLMMATGNSKCSRY
jgi:hypothetical protein